MDLGQTGDPRTYILGSQERGDGAVLTIQSIVPEPGTLCLLLAGFVSLSCSERKVRS